MKRILFVITTSDYGGTETYLRQLVERLDRRRFEPIVCSLCPTGRVGRQIEASGVRCFSLGMSGGTRPLELVRAVLALRRHIDELEVDLVLGLLYRANMLAVLAGRLSKRRPPVISGQRSLNPAGSKLMIWGVQATRGLARHVIAVSPAVKEEILATERVADEKITVLRNGVDVERWQRQGTGEPADRPGLDVAAAGRLTPVKGFHHLVGAVARLRRDAPELEIRVHLAGDGPEQERLEALVAEHGLGERVRLLGRLSQDQLVDLYSRCDVYALTSRAEGSPNAMLEAMSCGCAVVATAVGGVVDIVEEGRSGLLIPAEDPGALADALGRLARDEALRRALAGGARRRIEADFNLDAMVRAHEDLFSRLL